MTTAPRAARRPFPWHLIVFLGPAVALYSAFMVFPLLDSLRLSLFGPGGSGVGQFVGLDNYVRLLTDSNLAPRFWGALRNNIEFFAPLKPVSQRQTPCRRRGG